MPPRSALSPVEAPPAPLSPSWGAYVARLVDAGDDAALVQLATAPAPYAGSQVALARLAGTSEESICRAKRGGHGFSPAMRAWLRAYLLAPETPPAPLPRRPGQRSAAGVACPQVGVAPKLAQRFVALAAGRVGGCGALLTEALRRYLRRYGRRKHLPTVVAPVDAVGVRGQVEAEVLARFDARVGGAAGRGDYMRAAVVGLLEDDVTATRTGTTRRGSRGKARTAA